MLQTKALWYLLGLPLLAGVAASRYAYGPSYGHPGRAYGRRGGVVVVVPSIPGAVEPDGNLPPGLERQVYERGFLPPGLEKHLMRDGSLPPGLARRGGYYGVWSYPVGRGDWRWRRHERDDDAGYGRWFRRGDDDERERGGIIFRRYGRWDREDRDGDDE